MCPYVHNICMGHSIVLNEQILAVEMFLRRCFWAAGVRCFPEGGKPEAEGRVSCSGYLPHPYQ